MRLIIVSVAEPLQNSNSLQKWRLKQKLAEGIVISLKLAEGMEEDRPEDVDGVYYDRRRIEGHKKRDESIQRIVCSLLTNKSHRKTEIADTWFVQRALRIYATRSKYFGGGVLWCFLEAALQIACPCPVLQDART